MSRESLQLYRIIEGEGGPRVVILSKELERGLRMAVRGSADENVE